MRILFTGKPRSGKTTLLHSLIDEVASKRGLVATEVRNDGERIGFDLLDSSARTATLARTDKPTQYLVSRYFVDLASFNDFIEPLFEYKPGQLLYIDEIGHMQLFSEKFQRLASEYLDADNDFVGTISYVHEHPFIDEVRSRKDILLCTITPENREELKVALQAALAHREQFRHLSVKRQRTTLKLARVIKNDSSYSCDCDLFNGRNQFEGKADECSHIQAVKISL